MTMRYEMETPKPAGCERELTRGGGASRGERTLECDGKVEPVGTSSTSDAADGAERQEVDAQPREAWVRERAEA